LKLNPIIKDIWMTRLALAVWVVGVIGFLFILVRMAFGFVPPIINLTLLCNPNPPSENVLAYRFYERINNSWLFLGQSQTNGFVVSNVVVLIPHSYGVSASNAIGESDISAPYISPTDPHPPLKLHAQDTNALVLEATYNSGLDWFPVVNFTGIPTNLAMQRNQMFRSSRTNLPPLPR
jgi:hypothetical protein